MKLSYIKLPSTFVAHQEFWAQSSLAEAISALGAAAAAARLMFRPIATP